MKFKLEEMWKLISDIEKEPTPTKKSNATTQSPPINQATIFTWKKKDHITFVAI